MNFLAHSLLSFDNPDLMAGQICGDFVRGSDLSRFPNGVEKGIRLHRFLDHFTDTHPILMQQKRSLTVVPRRFSGILIDVLFDHFLAVHWHTLSEISLDEHAERVNNALRLHEKTFPESLQRFMEVLHGEHILQKNAQLSHIVHTLERIAARSPRFTPLVLTRGQLEPVTKRLSEPFEEFYPVLEEAALAYLNAYSYRECSL